MKNLFLVFALVISLSVQNAWADNDIPKTEGTVLVSYNGAGYLQVRIAQKLEGTYSVKVYDLNFKLLYMQQLNEKPNQRFDVSKFNEGFYLVLVEKNNRTFYTEVIEKVQDKSFAKY